MLHLNSDPDVSVAYRELMFKSRGHLPHLIDEKGINVIFHSRGTQQLPTDTERIIVTFQMLRPTPASD